MKITELLEDLVIKPEYKNNIMTDTKLHAYIGTANFTMVFYIMVNFLESFPEVKRKFIDGYTDQPKGCDGNTLLFSPLDDEGTALSNKWIARMPLHQNKKSILVYFPRDIVFLNDKLIRIDDQPKDTKKYHYGIPIEINKFIENPSAYISVSAVKKRLGC